MDKIILNKLQFYSYHGMFQEEKTLGQRFIVDLELYLPLQKAGMSDDMRDSIDYAKVYEQVKEVMESTRKNLIEAVAEAIATKLFDSFPSIQACTVKVTKPDPPIHGYYESVAVEIYREQKS